MQPHDRNAQPVSLLVEGDRAVSGAGAGRRARPRMNVAARLPAMQVRRIIVLAERFQELCALRSDPMRLIDLLRSLVACSREAFMGESFVAGDAHRKIRPSPDQVKCVEDLELLMQGLIRGAPGASRGLAHAMDALLMECVVFEAVAREAARDAAVVQG